MNYVYILTNAAHTVLYIGVTSNLPRRLYEHKHELIDGFTQTYHVHELMYAEPYSDIRTAIAREKQLKKWGRQKKNNLITENNPDWIDLSADWLSYLWCIGHLWKYISIPYTVISSAARNLFRPLFPRLLR